MTLVTIMTYSVNMSQLQLFRIWRVCSDVIRDYGFISVRD